MADAFLKLLRSSEGLPGLGSFDDIYNEVACRQGRPDFIALRSKNAHKIKALPKTTGLVGSSILSLLKPSASRTINYLIERSEYSVGSIKRSIKQLLDSGHVEKTQKGSYILGDATGKFQVEIWAFELKLNNTKRAVFQAQQSCAFAERSIIVVPPGQAKNYERYSETIKRWGIGLAVFDPITKRFSIKKRPRKSKANSRQHKIYAIAQLYLA